MLHCGLDSHILHILHMAQTLPHLHTVHIMHLPTYAARPLVHFNALCTVMQQRSESPRAAALPEAFGSERYLAPTSV